MGFPWSPLPHPVIPKEIFFSYFAPMQIRWISFCFLLLFTLGGKASELVDFLRSQEHVDHVEVMEAHSFFREALLVWVRQPVDHGDPGKGSFLQRVFVSALERSAPVVLVTEGYAAAYGKNPRYLNELCPLLGASQVVVEHRYFGESWPEDRDWHYLTVENAAGDHHLVTELLKPWFSGKWVNTGISKGGQTALLHRVFYPDDVDLTVSYVAPMNLDVEDGRHEPWIAKVSGDRESRRKIREFQLELLRRRDRLMPLFEKNIAEKKYTFRAPLSEIYDFTVLEFSFSFWQWGKNPEEIPALTATDEEIFSYWNKNCSPDYFSLEELERMGSFFIQAARQLGYYGYDTRPFRKYLHIKTARNYLAQLFLPEKYRPAFDRSSALKTQRFLNTTNLPMVFIYGKNDPWTASGVVVPRKSHILKVVQEGGSHSTRIATLDETNKKAVLQKIGETVSLHEPVIAE